MIDGRDQLELGPVRGKRRTHQNLEVLWEYLEKNGRMVDVYTYRDSIFIVPPRPGDTGQQLRQTDRLTQLGRALRELGIGSILAYSPQAKGRIERSFLTAQDRLVKQLRLAKIATLADANRFLETEYWPERNEHFARLVGEVPNHHRTRGEQQDLAAILCHVEERVIGNGYPLSFAGQHYQILRSEVQAGMRRQRARRELRLDGALNARYQGRYVEIEECGALPAAAKTTNQNKPVRKDHNAGGESNWMQGFFNRPSPPLWTCIRD